MKETTPDTLDENFHRSRENDGNDSSVVSPTSGHTTSTPSQEPSGLDEKAAESGGVLTPGLPYSVFTTNQKRLIVCLAAWGGFFSPFSAAIYFPALNSLARDFKVSNALINLTLTSYMIFQGLAPSVIGNLADSAGRRIAYITAFVIYIAANIGLACQNSYPALFVLRCLQSSGSSGTIALSSGVVSDIAIAAERGKYIGFVMAGSILGPAVGPIAGGLLAQYLGWRAIFLFLTIFGGAFLVIFAIFFPETARTVVGNGSIAPKGWNMSLLDYLALRRARRDSNSGVTRAEPNSTLRQRRKGFNPFASIQLLADKETATLVLSTGLLFAAFYDIMATIPSLFARIYGFNDSQIGLCYLPVGVGCCAAALSSGQLVDRNFHRWARKLNVPVQKGKQNDLRGFPVEKARLQIAIPCLYVSCAIMLLYGWVLDIHGPLAVLVVLLFLLSCAMTCTFNVTSALLVDFYPKASATATATNNLSRCFLGAGATAVVIPMVDAMGIGWTFTFLSFVSLASSPILWLIYFRGMAWREQRRLRAEKAEKAVKQKKPGRAEEAAIVRAETNSGPAEEGKEHHEL